MENKKIGFFEKWNQEAQKIEFSMTRLQMAIMTIFTLVFCVWSFIIAKVPITYEAVLLIALFLLAAVAPKALKDFAENIKK